MPPQNNLKQIRSLTLALFLSAAINVVLVAFIFYWAVTDRPPTPYCEVAQPLQPKQRPQGLSVTNSHLIRTYKALPFEQLQLKLQKKALVEDGYSERDLALAVLVAYFDFDVEKAFQGRAAPLQKRWIQVGEEKEPIQIYPGLSDLDYAELVNYVNHEKWPFKTKGLFSFLKQPEYQNDSSLVEAFCQTKEFKTILRLFTQFPVEQERIASLFLQSDYASFLSLVERVRKQAESLPEVRQRLLISSLQSGVKPASQLLLQTDYEFALKRLSDPSVEQLLLGLEKADPVVVRYLSAIASSPRSDKVKALAAEKYELLTEKKWEPLVSREQVTPKSLPIAPKPKPAPLKQIVAPTIKPVAAVKPKESLYIVQEGDSLWKIAKRYKLSVDRLRAYNMLKSDALKPGSALKIPDQPPASTAPVFNTNRALR